jgi:hypothetical protein
MFVVQPSGALWFGHDWQSEGHALAGGFRYGSDNNPNWLNVSQILLELWIHLVQIMRMPVGHFF